MLGHLFIRRVFSQQIQRLDISDGNKSQAQRRQALAHGPSPDRENSRAPAPRPAAALTREARSRSRPEVRHQARWVSEAARGAG